MALTGSFITYGAGQLVSGVLGDHISPKKLIFLGLSLTVLMNLCIPFCRNPYQMLVVWCFNGFAQSFLWPPLISFWGWRTVFFFSAICGIIMILVWNRYCEDAPVISIENASIQGSSQKNSFLSPLLLCIMLTIVLQGMLRDEVTTWMPSYISETYHLSHAAAILTGVLLPLFGLLCIQSASTLYIRKFSTPPFLCGSLLLHRDPALSGTFLFHRKKCRFFGFLFRPSHWLYARRQPDPGLYDPAFFQKAGKCIHCIRRFKLLYLHRKCDFHLWHCRPFRPDWLELHSSDLGSPDICRHSHLHSMRPALAKKILVKNYGKIPRPCVY